MIRFNLKKNCAAVFGALFLAVPMTFAMDFAGPAYAAKVIYSADSEAEESPQETGGPDEEMQALAAAEEAERAAAEEAAAREVRETELRQEVVDYALSFVGGRYVWGGNDPHTGADCSGFVRYVLQNAAGVSLFRSSRDQATQGRTVSAEEMKPGDLLFYGSGRSVNHVAMYIGDGQIVHASTERTGIKVSSWNYRQPLRIASFIG